ncbi:MAG: D-alanyl-D-alanine carboxypeptidase, partial [Brevundimonas sp. 32-68-21]
MWRNLIAFLSVCFVLAAAGGARAAGPCHTNADVWGGQALVNAASAYAMEWTPFGATEWGWRTYVPLIQRELHTTCGPGTPIFASQLAGFQQTHGLAPTGLFDASTFQVLRGLWQERRPFVMARTRQECPDPPPINQLGYLVESEEHADRLTRLLRRDVLDAYRRMVAAARAEVPEVAADPELL